MKGEAEFAHTGEVNMTPTFGTSRINRPSSLAAGIHSYNFHKT